MSSRSTERGENVISFPVSHTRDVSTPRDLPEGHIAEVIPFPTDEKQESMALAEEIAKELKAMYVGEEDEDGRVKKHRFVFHRLPVIRDGEVAYSYLDIDVLANSVFFSAQDGLRIEVNGVTEIKVRKNCVDFNKQDESGVTRLHINSNGNASLSQSSNMVVLLENLETRPEGSEEALSNLLQFHREDGE